MELDLLERPFETDFNVSLETMYPIVAGCEYVYALHCNAWKQTYVAREAPRFFPCTAMNPTILRRIWKGDQYKEVVCSLLPGYIFLFSSEQMDPGAFRGLDGALSVLHYAGGRYSLTEDDEKMARWLLRYDGTIGCSKAIWVGERIKVIQGPMKDSAGIIVDVNKGRRRAKVEINFNGKSWPIWMDFDFIES